PTCAAPPAQPACSSFSACAAPASVSKHRVVTSRRPLFIGSAGDTLPWTPHGLPHRGTSVTWSPCIDARRRLCYRPWNHPTVRPPSGACYDTAPPMRCLHCESPSQSLCSRPPSMTT
ncbi:unnamed protein product, partial [Musa acuminata var. zebrina]